MRGKGTNAAQFNFCFGITPAYAGKRNKMALRYGFFKDHPRLCGEKEADVQFLFHSLGSPPPMRGKEYSPLKNDLTIGIPPAYAGKRLLERFR